MHQNEKPMQTNEKPSDKNGKRKNFSNIKLIWKIGGSQ